MIMPDNQDNTDDEFNLFRAEMHDAEPIHHDTLPHLKAKPKPKVLHHQSGHNEFKGETFSDMSDQETVGNEQYLEYRGPSIQHKVFNKLRSGKVHIEAALDLHGMTVEKALPTLSEFLAQCQQENIRCARIIHGKGWGSKDNKPILKSKLNHWLRQSQIILAFCSATIDDGGTGAVYVLLRRIKFTD